MFETPHLPLLIVFQVCSIPVGRFNRCVPGTPLESRQPQYAHVCDKLEVVIALGLNQIVPCSQLMAMRGDSPVSLTLCWPLEEESWFSVPWHPDMKTSSLSTQVHLLGERLGFALAQCTEMSSSLLVRIKTCWWEMVLGKR